MLLKMSCMPKKQPVKVMNDVTLIALTSCIMKALDRVIHLQNQVAAFMDSLQFA